MTAIAEEDLHMFPAECTPWWRSSESTLLLKKFDVSVNPGFVGFSLGLLTESRIIQ